MENIKLNAITFALPARQFEISASVTVNESLPKVNEFVLRLIRVCGEIEGEEIARYFGFSGKEARLVLDALRDQSLIRLQDDLIRLTEYAESKFYSDDDMPRFSVVRSRTDNIDFDLLTFNPVSGHDRKKNLPFLVEIPCDNDFIGSSGRHAEQAYQRNFRKILRDKEKSKDVIDIYKISSTKSKNLFQIPIEVTFTLKERGEIERLIEYDDDASEDFRLAVDAAVSDVLQTSQVDQSHWFVEFVDYFDDPVLRKYIDRGIFDFERYVKEVFDSRSTLYRDARTPFIGNMYMPTNQEVLLRDITSALTLPTGGENYSSCIWMAPDYRFWGRSIYLDDFYTKLRKKLAQPKKKVPHASPDIFLFFPGTRETKWILEQQLWSNPVKNIHFHSGSVMGGRVEILLFPTSFACILFHLRPPGNSTALIPIGFTTTDLYIIEKAKKIIGRATERGRAYVGPAHIDKKKTPSTLTFHDSFAFLNYSLLSGSHDESLFSPPDDFDTKELPSLSKSHGMQFVEGRDSRLAEGGARRKSVAKPPAKALKAVAEETEDQIIFRSGERSEITFKIPKNQQWRGLMPLPSINNRAIADLARRIDFDQRKLSEDLNLMRVYVKELTPSDAAKKISESLGIPVGEVWRYFIDAMYISER